MESTTVFDSIKRNAIGIFSEEGLKKRLNSGKTLRIKLGADNSICSFVRTVCCNSSICCMVAPSL